jgi:hypothetical protein
MSLRTAAVSTGIAIMTAGGISVPAQAAEPRIAASTATYWPYVYSYKLQSVCINTGQEYEREGWNAYKCKYGAMWPKEWGLFIS